MTPKTRRASIMARRGKHSRARRARPASPAADPAVQAKGRRLIDRVRRYYELGRQAEALGGEVATEDLAAAAGVSVSTMRTIRRFAKQYTEDELTAFLALRRPNGLPLHAGHLGHLVTVPNRRERRKFEQEAAEQGWTADDLRVAIQQRLGKLSGHHTGHVKEPPTAEAGLLKLVHQGEWLQARCRAAIAKVRKEDSTAKLAKLAKRLNSAAEQLERVEAALREARQELEQLAGSEPKRRGKRAKKKGSKPAKKAATKKASRKAKPKLTKKASRRRR